MDKRHRTPGSHGDVSDDDVSRPMVICDDKSSDGES